MKDPIWRLATASCLAATFTSLFGVGTVMAQEVEEIVVSGRSLEETVPLDLARYGNRIEIVTAEEIERQGFDDIGQALQMLLPGLHIRPKNGAFDYFDASLQGSRGQEILWLIDGVRINNRLYNSTSPLDTVPAHMVDRIEVLKGGQGIFYGTQSVGGVVNIVTRGFSNSPDGAASVGMHSEGGQHANGYFRTAIGDHQFVAYASRDAADGYRPYRSEDIEPSATDRDRSYEVNVLGLKYAWKPSDSSRFSLQYQQSRNDLDFPRPFLNAFSNNERREDIITAKYDLKLGERSELFIKAYYHEWETLHTRIYNQLDASGNMTGGYRVLDDESFWGYEDYGLNAMVKLNLHSGFEYVLGLDHQNFSGVDDVWRIADQEEEVNAAFLQLRSTEELFENTAIALGFRHNRPSNADSATVWNLSAQHDLSDSLYLRTTLGTSFRLPDAEALFLNEFYDDNADGVPDGGWFAIGNPDLKPEQSRNINVGIGGRQGSLSYELIAFKREIHDYIASYVPLTIAGVTGESFINTDDEVHMHGAELISSMELGNSWSAGFSYTYTRAEMNRDGNQLPLIPETEAKLRLNYAAPMLPWGLSLTANYVGELTERRAQQRGHYTVIDVSGYYNFGDRDQHGLVMRIENLADREYATRVDVGTRDTGESYIYDNLGVGRTLHLSYRYSF